MSGLALDAAFRACLETAPDAMVVVDAAGRIVMVNARLEQLFGYSSEELCGQPVELLVPESAVLQRVEERRCYDGNAQPRPIGSGRTLRGRRKDGVGFPVEISLNPVGRDDSLHVLAAVRDVSAREQRVRQETSELEAANDELIRSRRELKEFLDAMSTLNAKVAPDGTLLLVNRQAQQASGLPPDELMRTNFLEGPWFSFSPEVQQRIRAAFARAVAGEYIRYEEQVFLYGRVVTLQITFVPVRAANGEVEWIVAEGADITRRVEAEAALRAANRELEAFTYSVSHDLRAPIRQIHGFSKLLAELIEPDGSAQALHYLRRIQEGAEHMGQLVDDLLHLARVGRQHLRPELTDLTALVSCVLEDLQMETAGRQIHFEIGELPAMECDPGLVKVVFTNLLANAIKYTRPKAEARIEVGSFIRSCGSTVLYVRDNGVGFDMKYADQLFGVFQRLHRPEEFEGVGVGLATVQRIVHKHGGEVWAEGEAGKGATFYFTLMSRTRVPSPAGIV